ncbi:MAG: hypothetical protein ACFB9M_21115, partial [Myxococcota bacterium]
MDPRAMKNILRTIPIFGLALSGCGDGGATLEGQIDPAVVSAGGSALRVVGESGPPEDTLLNPDGAFLAAVPARERLVVGVLNANGQILGVIVFQDQESGEAANSVMLDEGETFDMGNVGDDDDEVAAPPAADDDDEDSCSDASGQTRTSSLLVARVDLEGRGREAEDSDDDHRPDVLDDDDDGDGICDDDDEDDEADRSDDDDDGSDDDDDGSDDEDDGSGG